MSAYDNKLKDCDSNMFVNGRMLDILHEFRDVRSVSIIPIYILINDQQYFCLFLLYQRRLSFSRSFYRVSSKVNGSTSEKKALLEKARLECLKPLSDRTPDPSNPYMVPMGVTWLEFIRYVVKYVGYTFIYIVLLQGGFNLTAMYDYV